MSVLCKEAIVALKCVLRDADVRSDKGRTLVSDDCAVECGVVKVLVVNSYPIGS